MFFMDRMYKVCANRCRRYQTDTIEKNGRMSKFTLLVFNEGDSFAIIVCKMLP